MLNECIRRGAPDRIADDAKQLKRRAGVQLNIVAHELKT